MSEGSVQALSGSFIQFNTTQTRLTEDKETRGRNGSVLDLVFFFFFLSVLVAKLSTLAESQRSVTMEKSVTAEASVFLVSLLVIITLPYNPLSLLVFLFFIFLHFVCIFTFFHWQIMCHCNVQCVFSVFSLVYLRR